MPARRLLFASLVLSFSRSLSFADDAACRQAHSDKNSLMSRLNGLETQMSDCQSTPHSCSADKLTDLHNTINRLETLRDLAQEQITEECSDDNPTGAARAPGSSPGGVDPASGRNGVPTANGPDHPTTFSDLIHPRSHGDPHVTPAEIERSDEQHKRDGAYGQALGDSTADPSKPPMSPQNADYAAGVAQNYAQWPHAQAPALTGFGQAALANGDSAQAESLASRAIEKDGSSAAAFGVRAAARLSLGNAAGAREDARNALAMDPANRLASAVGQFAARMEADPSAKPPDPSKLIRDFGSSSAGSLAGGRRASDAPGASIEAGGMASSLGSERAGKASFATMTPSNKMAAEAEGLGKIGDLKGAISRATMAIDADKSNPEAYAVRAGLWNKQQRYLNAKVDANSALGLDPGHAKALNARAFANNMTGHPKEAQADAERVLAQNPRDAMGYLNLAISQDALGDVTRANENYQKATKLDPSLKPLYEEFLSKHPEVMGGGAGGVAGAAKFLPPALRTSKGAGGVLAALLALAAAGAASLKKKARSHPDDEEDAPLPAASAAHAAEQGAETIVLAPAGPAAEALATIPAEATVPAGAMATVPASGMAAGPYGGRLIAGNYELRKELGRGGMGLVYEAFDTSLSRKVALKEMRAEIAQSTRDKERFLAEARTVAKFQHPNIVSIYNILEESGRTFLVFEHVEGGGLDKILDEHRKLGPDAALPLLKSIAAALDYSHSRKVIHRDLKPSNIMITEEGVVKVMDFGIAHEAKQTVSRLTSAEAFGTMAYMPPEQELGQASRESDVFAFAVLAYETLLGQLPFPGPNFLAQKKGKIFARPSQADPTLPAALDAVFEKALEPEPKDRHHSAGELAHALSSCFSV
jgi:tetratricopeptide (TPR) repeat protein/tRNA A-37 threonylcarbamoyl transferase component Bud32